MTASTLGNSRLEVARLAFAIVRCASDAAHPRIGSVPPGEPRLGTEAWVFAPGRRLPSGDVEAFLAALPSPALLTPTLSRGEVDLTLVQELGGERRRAAEHICSNAVACFDEMTSQLGLTSASRILLEFNNESHVFSCAVVREWAGELPVSIGWNLHPMEDRAIADACLMLLRADGREFPGRSCMQRLMGGWPPDPDSPPPGGTAA